ncbi:putative lytic transglycosylase [Herminiimonas arsenicoxydans]|uniref:Lytic transglycosylase n=1 Tax=Herminiimonas arsenicoxydans TaxID=204773 RepID=A4G3Y3_HERAR|nr:putative lytic transglycosylase [Herminiimonas arsenicoxydans]
MLNRITTAMRQVANQSARQAIATSISMRDSTNRLVATARQAMMALGLTAIATLALMFFKPEIADRIQALSPFSEAVASTVPQEMPEMANLMEEAAADAAEPEAALKTATTGNNAMMGTDLQQQRVTQWISKRYRVANDATNMLVSAAYLTGKEINFDPLLILAVMAIESRFNPFAESPVGAQGLMQVMSKVHHDKFADMGGTKAALNPVANIKVGSLILKEYVARDGSVEGGLKRYVGAAAMSSDAGYGAKVLGEYDRLKAVASGKRVSAFATMASRTQPRIQPIPNPVSEKTALEDRTRDKNSNGEQYTAL